MNRIPPHDLDAEQSVLGACMESPDAISAVIGNLRAAHFYKPAHGTIYRSICELFAKGEPVDAVTVAGALGATLEKIGGKLYLIGLLESYPTASAAKRYARIIRDHAALRTLISTGSELIELAYSHPSSPTEALSKAHDLLLGSFDAESHARPLVALISEAMERFEQRYDHGSNLLGIASGFDEFDDMTAGLRGGQLIALGARPGMGKSAFLGDMAMSAGRAKYPVAMFSLEMSDGELTERFLSNDAKVNNQRLKRGTLGDDDWTRLSASLGRLSQLPIVIDDTPILGMAELRARCRRMKAETGLGLVILDYLQLAATNKGENRNVEIAELSRGLKVMARDLDVPVIIASQLNRGVEARKDKRPVLSDLRDSGAVEQDCDIVCFLYRHHEYFPKADANKAELIVAKHRNGPTGTVHLHFDGPFTKFSNSYEGKLV